MNFALMQYHKWSLTEIENLIPFEKEIYVAMLVKYLEEEKQRLFQEKVKELQESILSLRDLLFLQKKSIYIKNERFQIRWTTLSVNSSSF